MGVGSDDGRVGTQAYTNTLAALEVVAGFALQAEVIFVPWAFPNKTSQ